MVIAMATQPITAMAMAIQPITAPPPTTATGTLTVRAITDIDEHSTGHIGGIDAPTMHGPIMAAGVIAGPMPARTAGVTAAPIGGDVHAASRTERVAGFSP